MKKIISLLLSVGLVLAFAGCGTSAPAETSPQTEPAGVSAPTATEAVAKVPEITEPADVIEPEGELGDFYVKITKFELMEDHSGYPSVLLVYSFTNNSKESAAAMYEVSAHAYQNGVELPNASTYGLDEYDFNAALTKVQPGASIEIPALYRLTSDTAPVEFDIVESFSLYPKTIGDVFQISENGETVLSKAPQGVMDFSIDSVHVAVVSYRIAADYDDNPVLVLELGITNNSSKSISAGHNISVTAFQNGVELSSAYMVDGVDLHTRSAYLRPNAGTSVYYCFLLSDESPVDFELAELISLDDTVHKFTIELSK